MKYPHLTGKRKRYLTVPKPPSTVRRKHRKVKKVPYRIKISAFDRKLKQNSPYRNMRV